MERNYLQKVHRNEVTSETTWIFRSSKLYQNSTSKWRGNLLIFSLWRIDLISTSNRHRFDVVCPLGNKYSKSPVIKTHFLHNLFFHIEMLYLRTVNSKDKNISYLKYYHYFSLKLLAFVTLFSLYFLELMSTVINLQPPDFWRFVTWFHKVLTCQNSTIKFPSDNT